MPLLRISFDANFNRWDEPELKPERIAEKWFDDPADEQTSLYEAASPAEEVEAVAAFSLANMKRGVQVGHLVRIQWDDLTAAGIRPSSARPGNTSVVDVDFRHWEIPGDREPIHRLLTHIWSRVMLGEDRFRWVGKQAQAACMKRFLDIGPHLVTEEAKRRCRRKLQNRIGEYTVLSPIIQRELRTNPPVAPEGRIELLAREKWVQRLRVGAAGDAEEDWLSAEQELRQSYEQELLAYTLPHAHGAPH